MALPGEIVNSIFSRLVMTLDDKVKQGLPLTSEEYKNLRFFAEKHKSCHQFFVTKTEITQVEENKISKVLDGLETTDYEQLSKDAQEAMERMNTRTEIIPPPLPQAP